MRIANIVLTPQQVTALAELVEPRPGMTVAVNADVLLALLWAWAATQGTTLPEVVAFVRATRGHSQE